MSKQTINFGITLSCIMPDYEEIAKCVLKVLEENGPLRNREICQKVHALISHALSPDSMSCPHTNWNQKEWEHEIRRGICLLQAQGKITLDHKTLLYSVVP